MRKRSWPAVSHYCLRQFQDSKAGLRGHTICSFTVLPSSSIVRIFCYCQPRHSISIRTDSPYKVDAYGGDVAFGVGVIRESEQQAGFSDAGVTDKKKFEEVVVSESAEISARDRRSGQPLNGAFDLQIVDSVERRVSLQVC